MTTVPLTLYIHIPWCIRKCPYCDFNSHHAPQQLPEQAYVDALLADLRHDLALLPEWGSTRPIDTIFIGGGTPSLFSAQTLATLLDGIQHLLPIAAQAEITLEANPGTFEQQRFSDFRQAGINRLSVGIQSFNPEHLHRLGRVHSQQEALQAAHIARQAGFDNFNLDLMFGLPEQNLAQALQDLQQAIALAPTHLSWYQLTLEPNTLFYKQPPPLPEDDLLADMQLAGQNLLQQHHYQQYEVSAYAQAGKRCQHNLNYWTFGDYLAIGAGAHGKITDPHSGQVTRYQKQRQPTLYMQQALQGQARTKTQTLSTADLSFEFMLNALRLRDGFSLHLFAERTGLAPHQLDKGLQQALQRGWLKQIDDWIQPSEQGWLFLNEVMQLFLEDR